MKEEKELNLMLTQLRQPFRNEDIEWRIQSSGVKDNRAWAKVLAYVQARAIQERLDEVFGILGWQVRYKLEHFDTVDSKEHGLMDKDRQVKEGIICIISVYDKESNYITNTVKLKKMRKYELQLDSITYKLYGLTKEEIKIVENSIGKQNA